MLGSPTVDAGMVGTGVWEGLEGVWERREGVKVREDWESRACVREGDSVDMGISVFLASFLRGDGDLRGTSLGESVEGAGVGCFRLATASENNLVGGGGEPHIDMRDEGGGATLPLGGGAQGLLATGTPAAALLEPWEEDVAEPLAWREGDAGLVPVRVGGTGGAALGRGALCLSLVVGAGARDAGCRGEVL